MGHRVERRLAVHRYIPNELVISLPSQNVIDPFFTSSMEGVIFRPSGCGRSVHKRKVMVGSERH